MWHLEPSFKNGRIISSIGHVYFATPLKYKINNISLNAFLILGLVRLQSHDYLNEMEAAFEARCVDEMLMGDWEDVQIELGLLNE